MTNGLTVLLISRSIMEVLWPCNHSTGQTIIRRYLLLFSVHHSNVESHRVEANHQCTASYCSVGHVLL